MGEVSFLFPGDLEAAGGNICYSISGCQSHRFKGGASWSPQFRWASLPWQTPHLAVISTGPSSSGHPHRETLERPRWDKNPPYRSDGAVKISTNGKGFGFSWPSIQGLHRGPDSFAMLGGDFWVTYRRYFKELRQEDPAPVYLLLGRKITLWMRLLKSWPNVSGG